MQVLFQSTLLQCKCQSTTVKCESCKINNCTNCLSVIFGSTRISWYLLARSAVLPVTEAAPGPVIRSSSLITGTNTSTSILATAEDDNLRKLKELEGID